MKKLLIIAFFVTLALTAGEVFARPGCVPYEVAAGVLTNKHKEHLTAEGAWQGGAHIELWQSANGATWTILQVNAQGVACVGAAGKNWGRYVEPPELGKEDA